MNIMSKNFLITGSYILIRKENGTKINMLNKNTNLDKVKVRYE